MPALTDEGRGAPIEGLGHVNGVAVEPDCWVRASRRHLLELLTDHPRSTAYTKLQLYVDARQRPRP